jgi:hypothetical protein
MNILLGQFDLFKVWPFKLILIWDQIYVNMTLHIFDKNNKYLKRPNRTTYVSNSNTTESGIN